MQVWYNVKTKQRKSTPYPISLPLGLTGLLEASSLAVLVSYTSLDHPSLGHINIPSPSFAERIRDNLLNIHVFLLDILSSPMTLA
jgi:hypothetical protein